MRSVVGEAPTWDAATRTLLWVDIHGKLVHRLSPATGAVQSGPVPQRVGAVVPTADGGLLLGAEDGFWLADADASAPRPFAVAADKAPDARFNDGRCDRAGNFVAGTIGAGFARGTGALYRVDREGAVERLRDDLWLSNGVAFSPDGATMYHVDTKAGVLRAFAYEPTAPLGDERILVEIAPEDGLMDGITVDAEGYLWVAFHTGSCVRRYSRSGVLDGVIEIPVSKVTNCAFGGDDLADLYITSSSRKVDLEQEPFAGLVFRCRPGVRGLPETPFGGGARP